MEDTRLTMATNLLLRRICNDSDWVYAVFWRIHPRSYPPPKWENESLLYDRSKGNKRNWILTWEDGFCNFNACALAAATSSDVRNVLQPDTFFKMSHDVYNFGEGLMGKIAADNGHKWIFKEPAEAEMNLLAPWRASIDPHPRTWEAQFNCGIQTIAVIAVKEGLVQLGSTEKVAEDPNFIMDLQRKFNYVHSIPGVFMTHPSSYPLPNNSSSRPSSEEIHPPSLSWTTTASSAIPSCFDQTQQHNISPLMFQDHHHHDAGNIMNSSSYFHHHQQQQQLLLSPNMDKTTASNQQLPMSSGRMNMDMMRMQIPAAAVTPSMSSLQNLLSKLPSVTSVQTNSLIQSPTTNTVITNPAAAAILQQQQQQPRSQSFSSSHHNSFPAMNFPANTARNFSADSMTHTSSEAAAAEGGNHPSGIGGGGGGPPFS